MQIKRNQLLKAAGLILYFFILYSCTTDLPTAGIHITNSSGYPVTAVYVTGETSQNWGENRIDNPIQPETLLVIDNVAQIASKIKIIFLDGITVFENILFVDLSHTSILHLEMNPEPSS